MEQVIIIGSGPAGLTAALYCGRANLSPLVISGDLPGGQLTQTSEVENYPGFPNGINGFDLIELMTNQAKKFGARIQTGIVTNVELKNKGPHTLELDKETKIQCQSLIIAVGAKPKWLGLNSENILKNHGVSSCAICDGSFFRNVPVVVVGGGEAAIEDSIFLTRFASKVILVHRRDSLRATDIMKKRIQSNPKIEFVWNSIIEDILDVNQNKVTGVKVKNVIDNSIQYISCSALFVAIGHIPNTDIFKNYLEMKDGYIIRPNEDISSMTSLEGVFVAGDCSNYNYKQAIVASSMGCQAAIDVERWLSSR